MPFTRCQSATLAAAVVALTSSVSTFALAQSSDASRTLANNDALFIDGRTFNVMPGASKGNASAQISKLGARELGSGAIIFRSGDKLYIADSAPIPRSALMYNPGNVDCSRAASDPTCLPVASLGNSDIERQRPLGLRDQGNSRQAQLDYERQRPQGLRDEDMSRQQAQLDYERQRPQGLRDEDMSRQQAQLDYERQRPQGLRDTDVARQQPQGLRDQDYARQQPQGLRDQDNPRQQAQLDYERQRPQGLRDTDVARQQPQGLRDQDYARQQPQGLRDQNPDQQAQLDYERQRPLGLRDAEAGPTRVYVNDPDYSYYRLKKAFEEGWTPVQK